MNGPILKSMVLKIAYCATNHKADESISILEKVVLLFTVPIHRVIICKGGKTTVPKHFFLT